MYDFAHRSRTTIDTLHEPKELSRHVYTQTERPSAKERGSCSSSSTSRVYMCVSLGRIASAAARTASIINHVARALHTNIYIPTHEPAAAASERWLSLDFHCGRSAADRYSRAEQRERERKTALLPPLLGWGSPKGQNLRPFLFCDVYIPERINTPRREAPRPEAADASRSGACTHSVESTFSCCNCMRLHSHRFARVYVEREFLFRASFGKVLRCEGGYQLCSGLPRKNRCRGKTISIYIYSRV